jgi:hypothetical protein
MDEATRNEIANSLQILADQAVWNPEAWQRCHDLVDANCDDELVDYVYDDVVHYYGVYHSYSLLGFRAKPDGSQLEQYRQEFRDIASALRSGLPLSETKKKYGF